MTDKSTLIIRSSVKGGLDRQCEDILGKVKDREAVISIVFFAAADRFGTYRDNENALRSAVRSFYGNSSVPLVSYVAQAPSGGLLVAEILSLESCGSTVVNRNEDYVTMESHGCKELITRGINFPEDGDAGQQSDKVFRRIRNILDSEGFSVSDIVRQWNYIADITCVKDGVQNYQLFNDSRSAFYAGADWKNGYPAATGIGCSAGGVTVAVYAVKGCSELNLPIDNPLQVPAHRYSEKVLASGGENRVRTTPKFERGRLLGKVVFVSGTAAIRGENSEMSTDARRQALSAIDVVESLVSPSNISDECSAFRFGMIRVYVRRAEDMETVREVLTSHFKGIPIHFLKADICRPELLLELEGIGRAEMRDQCYMSCLL